MLNIALFGYGTVGRGVCDMVSSQKNMKVVKIFDRPSRYGELGDLLETDAGKILSDPAVSAVVECLGGDEKAYPVITEALKNGKHVVTSNKETVSKHLGEYLKLANEHGVYFQFEASVGGGIPLIYLLTVQKDFDEIVSLEGILNGTDNFILTKMQEENLPFLDAVKEAQLKGFAEKDPSADLEGIDLVRKANILTSLVSKKEVRNEDIPHFGIENIDAEILEKIREMHRVLKETVRIEKQGDSYSVLVVPCAYRASSALAGVRNETNAILIEDRYNGELEYVGKGAGRYPTASAILSDLVRVQKRCAYPYPELEGKLGIAASFSGTYLLFSQDGEMKKAVSPKKEELEQAKFVCLLEE